MDNEEVLNAAGELVRELELVFDMDWELTRDRIASGGYIAESGTFLKPNVDDEENDWANRARLLEAYRRLTKLLERR